jgi:hypothetical protein
VNIASSQDTCALNFKAKCCILFTANTDVPIASTSIEPVADDQSGLIADNVTENDADIQVSFESTPAAVPSSSRSYQASVLIAGLRQQSTGK